MHRFARSPLTTINSGEDLQTILELMNSGKRACLFHRYRHQERSSRSRRVKDEIDGADGLSRGRILPNALEQANRRSLPAALGIPARPRNRERLVLLVSWCEAFCQRLADEDRGPLFPAIFVVNQVAADLGALGRADSKDRGVQKMQAVAGTPH